MRPFFKIILRPHLAILLVALMVTACSHVRGIWLPGTMGAAANDQIMLVRKEPMSFGFLRLETQSKIYPDLALFVSKHGIPSFLAETHNRELHYFILYYLEERLAYACRSQSAGSRTVEFAGPYPVTEREFKLLDGFRKDPHQRPRKW
jgi:hypothetical protein